MIDFIKVSKIYGTDVMDLIKENIDEVKDNLNYLKNKGIINFEDIFERFAVAFIVDNQSFINKTDALINNLGPNYIELLEEDSSLFEVML